MRISTLKLPQKSKVSQMNATKTETGLGITHRTNFGMSRQATFMLAITTIIAFVT